MSETLVVIIDHALALVMTVVGPVLAGLAVKWLSAWSRKHEWDMAQEQQAKLEQLLVEAIHYAEEQGRKALRGLRPTVESAAGVAVLGNSALSAVKLDAALTYAEAEMKRRGWDALAKDKLAALIEAKLPSLRVDPSDPVPNYTLAVE